MLELIDATVVQPLSVHSRFDSAVRDIAREHERPYAPRINGHYPR